MGKVRKKAWQMTPLCIFWLVWKERNMLAFGNEELLLQRRIYSPTMDFCLFIEGLFAFLYLFILFFIYNDG